PWVFVSINLINNKIWYNQPLFKNVPICINLITTVDVVVLSLKLWNSIYKYCGNLLITLIFNSLKHGYFSPYRTNALDSIITFPSGYLWLTNSKTSFLIFSFIASSALLNAATNGAATSVIMFQ